MHPEPKIFDNRSARSGPQNTHFRFIVDGRQFAYCRIRKNACSAIQRFIIETSPYRRNEVESDYKFLRRQHRVSTLEGLRSADHRILIARDPVERIQSVFVNKFIQRNGNVGIFDSYSRVTGLDPHEANFRTFVVEYVSRLGDDGLDPHVWPQTWYLCPVVYDIAIRLDDLAATMSRIIGAELASKFFDNKVNASEALELPVDSETSVRLAEIYAADYRMLERIT
jgi:hypothetical protein